MQISFRHSLSTGLLCVMACLLSCTHTNNAKTRQVKEISRYSRGKTKVPVEPTKYLFLKNDSIGIRTDKKIFWIPNDTTIAYKNFYNGILEIENGLVNRHYNLVFDDLIYFTTYSDVGMGYRSNLYVFNTKTHKLVNEPEFKHNYVYSSAGIFIIDRANNKIFAIGKPAWFERKDIFFTPAAMYQIKGDYFEYLKIVYQKGELCNDNSSLVKFYDQSLANNAANGIRLPNNWWK